MRDLETASTSERDAAESEVNMLFGVSFSKIRVMPSSDGIAEM